jgi:hypothetical protein
LRYVFPCIGTNRTTCHSGTSAAKAVHAQEV